MELKGLDCSVIQTASELFLLSYLIIFYEKMNKDNTRERCVDESHQRRSDSSRSGEHPNHFKLMYLKVVSKDPLWPHDTSEVSIHKRQNWY